MHTAFAAARRAAHRPIVLLVAVLAAFASCSVPATAQIYSETFDAVTAPEVPSGWSGDWVTSGSSTSTGSGANNLVDTGTGAADAVSGSFSLEGVAAATLRYLARRTSSYPEGAVTIYFVVGSAEITVSGNGLPATSSSWVEMEFAVPEEALGEGAVSIRFASSGGTSSGSNARIDDVEVTAGGVPPAQASTLGFATTDTTNVLAGATGYPTPIDLLWTGQETLQGVQFDLADSGSVTLAGLLRGSAVSDIAAWTVSLEPPTSLVIANGASGLAGGEYPSLVQAVWDIDDVTDTTIVALSLSNVVGALAVPEGTDAELVTVNPLRYLRIIPRSGLLAAPDSLDLGAVPVDGSASESIWLHNAGTASLVLSAIASSDPVFTVDPAQGTILPGDSLAVAVTFTPGAGEVGLQSAQLLVDGQPATILEAEGVALWGDATADGLVDVGDIVAGVDVVLGRTAPTSELVASLDLFPFPQGDEELDVRDLTVLTHAVLLGQWPNAYPLPVAETASPILAGKAREAARFVWSESLLSLELTDEVRAVQADFRFDGTHVRVGKPLVSGTEGGLRVVWAPLDGGTLSPGTYPVAELQGDDAPRLMYGVSISPTGARIGLDPDGVPETPKPFPRPYPNPFAPSRGDYLVLPVTEEARVVDVLGREVWRGVGPWDGRSRDGTLVAPGFYAVRGHAVTWPIMVIR